MRIWFIILLTFASQMLFAREPEKRYQPEEPAPASPQILSNAVTNTFTGKWRAYPAAVGSQDDEAILTFNLPAGFSALFNIHVTDDKADSAKGARVYAIEQNPAKSQYSFLRGNTVLLRGAGFWIKAVDDTVYGTWSLLFDGKPVDVPVLTTQSLFNHGSLVSLGKEHTLVSVAEPRLFLITLDALYGNANCVRSVGTIMIDEKIPLDSKGKPKPMHEGNTILSYGKTVKYFGFGTSSGCPDTYRHKISVSIINPADLPQ